MASPLDSLRCDVAIIGYGPVGKLLAILLGRKGHNVVVVERQTVGYPLPRAVTHDSEFARILQSIGLPPNSIPDVTEAYDDMYVWKNRDGEILLEVDWSGIGPSGWNNTYFFNQPDLEDRMATLVEGLDTVRVFRGFTATDHEETANGVQITLQSIDRADVVLHSKFMIAADGANSATRQRLGIAWNDLGYFFDWLVVDVVPSPDLAFPHVATQNCNTDRPSTMVPGGPGRRRWEFMRLDNELAADLNRAEKAWNLLAPFGLTPSNSELERHSVYTFQAGWSTSWRQGRVLLAGDAAHLMPPFAGQGLGAGFRDANNLAWKLDLVLRKVAPATVLDSYGSERTPHVSAFVDFSMMLGKVICITDPVAAHERDIRMINERSAGGRPPTPPAPSLGAGVHVGAHGGSLSFQGEILDGERARLLDDYLGGAGALILSPAHQGNDLESVLLESLEQLSVKVVQLAPDGAPRGSVSVDLRGSYSRWFEELGATAVIVRPDFYVYGTANGIDAARALAESFVADLGARH